MLMKNSNDNTPMMEKFGLWYLYRLRKKYQLSRIDNQAYILDETERENINRIERNAIIRASVIGVISTVISGLAGFYADPLQDKSADFFSVANFYYWLIVGGITIIASLIEIMYLYYDTLKTVHKLTYAAHLEMFPENTKKNNLSSSLARAALELPNEKENDLRIDPMRESSKLVLLFASLLYKLKVSVTSFLAKALIKRMFGRAISRAWLNFVAVPVCAFWNGYVCWLILREVKIRVLGPSAANDIIKKIREQEESLSENGRYTILRAIGSCIVRTQDMHPNLEYMYRRFDELIKEPEEIVLDDSKIFLQELEKLNSSEQEIVLKVLIFASIIDGKITFRERKLLDEAFVVCGRKLNFKSIKNLVKQYRNGKLVNIEINAL